MKHFANPISAAINPDFTRWQLRLVRAFRVAALTSETLHEPQQRLTELLGTPESVRAFRLLLEGMAQVWPDPLTVFRPCCLILTHDETALIAMVTHAGNNDRRAFDMSLAEMLGADARDWLYIAAGRVAAELTR